jgi:hypothetical protein
MEFVFVNLAQSNNCFEVSRRRLQPEVVRQWECRAPSSGTGAATAYLREWSTVPAGQQFYSDKFGRASTVTDNAGVPVFDKWVGTGTGEAVELFVLAPFSLSIDAPESNTPLQDLLDYIAEDIKLAPAFRFPNYSI